MSACFRPLSPEEVINARKLALGALVEQPGHLLLGRPYFRGAARSSQGKPFERCRDGRRVIGKLRCLAYGRRGLELRAFCGSNTGGSTTRIPSARALPATLAISHPYSLRELCFGPAL